MARFYCPALYTLSEECGSDALGRGPGGGGCTLRDEGSHSLTEPRGPKVSHLPPASLSATRWAMEARFCTVSISTAC